jgi:hypothetical protein
MARIPKIAELQARKEALITESEVCRENLLAEIDNLKSYADGVVRKVDRIRQVGPWFMFAAPVILPVLGLLLGKKFKTHHAPAAPKANQGKLAKLMMAFRLYSKYGPILRTFANRLRTRHNSTPRPEPWTSPR